MSGPPMNTAERQIILQAVFPPGSSALVSYQGNQTGCAVRKLCDQWKMLRRVLLSLVGTLGLFFSANAEESLDASLPKLNRIVLEKVREMPQGGSYSTHPVATIRLKSAAHFESGKFFVLPGSASPSYCSGATYLVFLKTVEELRARSQLSLDYETLNALMIREGQRDGAGVWGRWNANGPGTARLFHELGLGKNFDDFAKALPGDFMKIFWTSEVGKLERGHSVVFLGTEKRDGVEQVRFWSSNVPAGYGEKSVPRTKIAQAIFSRLEAPENLARIKTAPELDAYLAGLLTNRSSFEAAKKKCGM